MAIPKNAEIHEVDPSTRSFGARVFGMGKDEVDFIQTQLKKSKTGAFSVSWNDAKSLFNYEGSSKKIQMWLYGANKYLKKEHVGAAFRVRKDGDSRVAFVPAKQKADKK